MGQPALTTLASFYQIGSMGPADMDIKGLDDAVGRRLREQAAADEVASEHIEVHRPWCTPWAGPQGGRHRSRG